MAKLIEKLTEEQKKQIPVYLERYRQIGLSTEPTDRAKAEAAVTASRLYLKQSVPKYVWAKDPFEGAVLAAQTLKGSLNVTPEEVKEQASKASYGSFEAYWISFYAFIAEQLPVQKDNLIDIVKEIVTHCGVYWSFEDTVIMSPKPSAIHMKDKKLHNPDGFALEYASGRGVVALEGKRYSSLLEATIQNKAKE